MILPYLVLLFSLIPSITQGLDITGSISPNTHLLSASSLPPTTLLILSSSNLEYKTHPTPNGSFKFRNVTAGPSYILQIECLTHTFSPLRVDTQNEDDVEVYQTFRGNAWSHRGVQLAYPIQIAPSAQADYYFPRSGFRIDSLFKNPMILLALFSLAVVFIVPRLTASLDPEALAEYRAQQAETAASAPQLPSFDIASFMAGSSKKPAVDQTRKTK